MEKVVFIIPYFGKFNNYFQLFLNSCAYNKNFEWLIFTDDTRNFKYPDNVKVIYTTFDKLKTRIQELFDFPIILNNPYKLCDFRPAYGLIFEEYIKEYQFWGYCDTDVIWGNISDFIKDEDLMKYDKICVFGHCSLYKNNKKMNNLFKVNLNGEERYKIVMQRNRTNSFDEEFNGSINNIMEQEHLKIRYREDQANIYTKSSDFRLVNLNKDKKTYTTEKLKKAFFVWDNGNLLRYILKNDEVYIKKYMYIHLQSRKMKVNLTDLYRNKYKIIPNAFDELEISDIDKNTFKKIKIKHFNLHYFKLRSKNLREKIKRRLTGYYNS